MNKLYRIIYSNLERVVTIGSYYDRKYKYYKSSSCGEGDDKYYKGSSCHSHNKESIEFQYDERLITAPILVPPAPAAPLQILTVNFDKINTGDRVWLSGIVSLNNNNNVFSTVTLTITRISPLSGTPQVIYTQVFEIDNEGDDDQIQTPFSHVDVPTTQLFDVRYQVRVTVGNPNLFVQGVNTLTALRFSR
ncbi:hypothetical protein CN570_19325 [Bacillus toyonensis]|uniref:hypothetical protein n=1 Tax=Bacillus toyonensis TaxID=155322 RepID=UPI00032ED273|nr:hypothetical protein [Bacillus toyonensis]EOP20031.1 hypothetical protein IIS_05967 [Bacillus cereus VD131]MBJ8044284.1 hypothetical protein [Bacillus cereus group sp. N17]MBJ8068007.1 hypothetical protein [Bacillus cereus group sp. N15]PEJ00656.1 hypothetical protein CN671_19440 [Bacillus toyonensis]PEO77463.1 hypothetical protein CN570_19325 [Bacillus toyonensis]